MGILNNPAILRIRIPFQDFQAMEILNLKRPTEGSWEGKPSSARAKLDYNPLYK